MAESDEKTERPRKTAGTRKSASVRKTASAPRADGDRKPAGARSADGSGKARGGLEVALQGARQLQQLTGNEVEGITGMHRTDDGWRVQVDVLELRRVPNTTDVLATYDVDVDADGDLVGYRRRHRYVRGEVGDDR